MHLTAKERINVSVQKSRNGKGIFAKKGFPPDKVIFEVTGVFVTCNEDEEMAEEERANTYRYDRTWYISPKGSLGDMLNHSCEPNAKVVKKNKKLLIVALAKIPKGTEVAIDYSTILASDDSWNMACNCGTPFCRKVVKQFKRLPKKLQEKYIAFKIAPRYILAI